MWANFENDPCRGDSSQKLMLFLLLSIVKASYNPLKYEESTRTRFQKLVFASYSFTVYNVDIATLQEALFFYSFALISRSLNILPEAASSIIPIYNEETAVDSRRACNKRFSSCIAVLLQR